MAEAKIKYDQMSLEELMDRAAKLTGLLDLYNQTTEEYEEDGVSWEETGLLDENSEVFEGTQVEILEDLASVNAEISRRSNEPVQHE